jgi:hypothetical protein
VPPAWTPDPNEVQPAVKQVAVEVVTALLAHPAGGAGAAAARARVAALGQDPGLVDSARSLVDAGDAGGAAAVEVVDAQYGGILATTSSVLVVCRRWTTSGGAVASGGTTVDVRLSAGNPRWRVTAVTPADPGAPGSVSAAAQQVLRQSDRITLPPAAEADIRSGQVHDSVLRALLALAQTYRIGVSVVRSGHPTYVFGTNRLSDHPRGRAFDTWQIDGHPVVSAGTPRSLVTGYMQKVAALGSYNVGGPYQLSGAAFFSDNTHHDHVHAGFQT